MTKSKQLGFSAVEGLLIVLVLAAIGGVGYFAMHRTTKADDNVTTTTSSYTVPAAPEVKDNSDLTTAAQTLDDSELDVPDSELNAELSGF